MRKRQGREDLSVEEIAEFFGFRLGWVHVAFKALAVLDDHFPSEEFPH